MSIENTASKQRAKKDKCRTIVLAPNCAHLIQAMRCVGYTLETALADILDNSITAGAEHISVQFRWNDGNPWLAILDDGCGMSSEKLQEAMRFGGDTAPSETRDAKDLGRYGLGLKTASLSQCRRLTVVTKQMDDIHALEWDVDYLSKCRSSDWPALIPFLNDLKNDVVVAPLLVQLQISTTGTIVLWRNLDTLVLGDKRKATELQFTSAMVRASKHIGLVFHRFLSPDEPGRKALHIDFNGTLVEPLNPFGSAVPARRELASESITVDGKKIHVQPFVLPHYNKTSRADYEKVGGEEGYRDNQGFYVYRNRRLIVKGTWFRLTPKTELTKLLRVRVDIPNSLDHLWNLDVKKSQAHPPQIVLNRLKEIIQNIANAGRRVYVKRGTRTVADIIHIWAREIANGKASYTLNENHPFVRHLIEGCNGGIDSQKLSFLRIISDAFPVHAFHLDANDDKTEIVSIAKQEETLEAVANLIHSLREAGSDEATIKKQLAKTELPLNEEKIAELIKKEFING